MFEVFVMVVGGLFFLFCYRLGVQDGIDVQKGRDVRPIDPIKTVAGSLQSINSKPKNDDPNNDFLVGLNNIMAYDGKPQLKKEVV